jgi:hypothetical protein
LDYRLRPNLTIGLEHTPSRDEILPRATWFALGETESRPNVVFGVASDRLSTPEGQAYFVTFSKTIDRWSPFVSLKYSSDDGMVAFPFGLNIRASDRLTAQLQNDGNYTHALLTYSFDWANVSLMLARMKHPGVAISFGF